MLLRVLLGVVLIILIGIGVFVFFEGAIRSFFGIDDSITPQIPLGPASPLNETGLPRYELQSPVFKNKSLIFEHVSLPIHRHQLFDFGVADINQDGLLDVFSSNCNFRPSILLNRGGLTFENAVRELQLGLLPELSEFACSMEPPKVVEVGLSIYYLWQKLHIYYLPSSTLTRKITVDIRVPHKRTNLIEHQGDIIVHKIIEQGKEDEIGETHYNLIFEREALVVLDIDRPSIPVEFKISDELPLNKIYIGTCKMSPTKHHFTLNTFDRHTYSWADINNDGRMDVFSGRGGLRGSPEYEYLRRQLKDQLFINKDNNWFENVYDDSGLVNCGCGTRKSYWVNIDNDKSPELFVICARNEPCRLFRRETQNEKYKECSELFGLNIIGEQPCFWFDMNDDGFIDLLSFYDDKLCAFVNQNGTQFRKESISNEGNIILTPAFLSACDFDNDGQLEFFFANHETFKTFLIRHIENTHFEWLEPNQYGLPEKSLWASWADFNNDGFDDFISIPEGVFINNNGASFTSTSILSLNHIPVTEMVDARVECFDGDNDGKQDVILGYRIHGDTPSGYGPWWYLSFFHNLSITGNWVQFELYGPEGNPQSFGTKVLCKTEEGWSKVRVVGESEHSRSNQGHYRLYFGLGDSWELPYFIISSQNKVIKELRDIVPNRLIRQIIEMNDIQSGDVK